MNLSAFKDPCLSETYFTAANLMYLSIFNDIRNYLSQTKTQISPRLII